MNPTTKRGAPAAALLCALLASACQSSDPAPGACPAPALPGAQATPTLEETLNARIQNPFDATQTVSLFYATDRLRSDPAPQCVDPFFSIGHGGGNRYGVCRVSVPVNREVGSLDRATEVGSNVHTTFRSLEHTAMSKDEFLASMITQPEDVIVFVHGFNVRFEEATHRAAQIVFDTKFQGTAYLYSWPAGAPERLLQSAYIARTYAENKANAEKAIPDFREFLSGLVAAKKRIFLVVHSMGHQVALPVLAAMADEAPKAIQELVLNAPDFPADDFDRIRPALLRVAARTTLYCSPADNAIIASQRLNGNARAGGCRAYPGVDVINVADVDTPTFGIAGLGHGYYSGRPVIGDLSQVLLGLKAEKRLFIQKSLHPDRESHSLRK